MQLKSSVKFVNKDKTQFFPTLKKRVDNYFTSRSITKYANRSMVIKTIAMLGLYFIPFILLLIFQPSFSVSLLLWLIMGVGVGGIGMSVMHDANHGAYSSKAWINTAMGYTLNLAGGAVLNWKLQHNVLHHTYTNVVPMDQDIRDRYVVRLSPHSPLRILHKLQWIYAFFFYGILTLYWVLLKDFIQHFDFVKEGVNKQTKVENRKTLLKFTVMKLAYLGVLIVLPVTVFNIPLWEVMVGFLTMHFASGLILTVIFQLAHTVEGTAHPVPDEQGIISNDWAVHQLQTTVNFSPDNKLLSWYIGGLNYQIEHHLFPRICHIHYPAIAPLVKQTAAEFGLEYMENETFTSALRSHINTLQRFGTLPHINEAIA